MPDPEFETPDRKQGRESGRIHITEEDARQGRIALRRPWQRWVFFVPLALLVIGGFVVVLVLGLP